MYIQNAARTFPDSDTELKSMATTPNPGPTTPRQHAAAEIADREPNWGFDASVMEKATAARMNIITYS